MQPGAHLSPTQRVTRGKIVAAIGYHEAAGLEAGEAVDRFVRDAAFTTLNRFVALKMLESRELIQQAITNGESSSGYREFTGLAPGVTTLGDGAGYRLYLESLFDELASEVKVLFDRHDAASLLWPRRNAFEEMLAAAQRHRAGVGVGRRRDDRLVLPVLQQQGRAAADARREPGAAQQP